MADAADITCSFPVVDKGVHPDGQSYFEPNQRITYTAVLAAQEAVIQALRPGVSWPDMHRLAERTILRALLAAGVLQDPEVGGGTEEEALLDAMVAADLGAVFMPHGLGHLIGLDTHDVGGYLEGKSAPRSERPGLRSLRMGRTVEEGMVLTVEPGCYFIDILLDRALSDPSTAQFLCEARLNEFRGLGGVRLEDDVHIREEGCENLTVCPRTIAEVESVLSGGPWPPEGPDEAPRLRRRWCRPNKDVKGGCMATFER